MVEFRLAEEVYRIRTFLNEFNGDHGLAVRYILTQLDKWAQDLVEQHPEILSDAPNSGKDVIETLSKSLSFATECFMFPEKNTIKQFILESEMLAGHVLKSSLGDAWSNFRDAVERMELGHQVELLLMELPHPYQKYSVDDNIVTRNVNIIIEGYLFVLSELVELGEFIYRAEVINLLEEFLWFIHDIGVNRTLPTLPGAWTDMENKRFRRLSQNELDVELSKIDSIFDNSFFFCSWKDARIILMNLRLDAELYNSRCAIVMDVKDPYNRVILYAFTNLFIDIIQVKTGQVPDGGIRTILIQAIRSVSTIAEMQAMEATRAKQQAMAEKGARVKKEKSDEVLYWVASAAQFLLDAFPFLDDGEVAAVLSSPDKRAERAKLLSEPAQTLLLEPPTGLGKHRTIRDKITQARAQGLIISPPSPNSSFEEIEP